MSLLAHIKEQVKSSLPTFNEKLPLRVKGLPACSSL